MKLLVLTSRFPYPVEKGDKLRIFHQIRVLAKRHEIVLCALSEHDVKDEDYQTVAQYCDTIHIFRLRKKDIFINTISAFFKGLPLQIGYFFKHSFRTQIHQIIKDEQPDHIYCQLIRMAQYVRTVSVPKTLDYMDTFSIGAKRRSEKELWFLRPIFKREAQKLVDYETAVFKDFTHHTIISAQDRDLLPMAENQSIDVVPNGVDMEFFHPMPKVKKKYDLVFVGNMGYHPNVEAVKFLAQEILPKLRQHYPKITLLIAGARPTAEVQRLASDTVTVSGWIDDIREAYASARIFAAPLFLGSGLQNKILEAMAIGVPCITTSLVNNAIQAIPNESVMIADDADAFVAQIIKLKENEELQKKLSEQGLIFVQDNFSWERFVRQLEELF